MDIRRDTSSKYATQWRNSGDRGPLVVKENRPRDGQVIVVTDKGREVRSRYQDVRHTLLLATESLLGRAREAVHTVAYFALSQRIGYVTTIGWAQ